jgi:uncharacterized protein YjbI with pentapeptide repeats
MEGKRRPLWIWALACLLGLAIILAVWKLPSWLYGDVSEASPDARLQAASGFRTALVAGLAGLAALGSLLMATRTFRLTQQGQITERYTKAIEQLGSDKLDVRLGGIYALERIAKDSRQDHPTVVEVLSAFVREHSNSTHSDSGPSTVTVLSSSPQSDSGSTAERQDDGKQRPTTPQPTTDVRAAVRVLGRLPSLPNVSRADLSSAQLSRADLGVVNLRKANLRKANLEEANLGGANLEEANLEEANLRAANLRAAHLREANLRADLQGAALSGADLQGAMLEGANLQGAWLRVANLQRAQLPTANLQGANLQRANLQGADLVWADLQGADLREAHLEGADLVRANLQGANLDGAWLQEAEGGADTVWPDGFDWKAAGVILQDD